MTPIDMSTETSVPDPGGTDCSTLLCQRVWRLPGYSL